MQDSKHKTRLDIIPQFIIFVLLLINCSGVRTKTKYIFGDTYSQLSTDKIKLWEMN